MKRKRRYILYKYNHSNNDIVIVKEHCMDGFVIESESEEND